MKQFMTFSEYAEYRGISQPSVSRAVQAGRLVESVTIHEGKRVLEVEVADREWFANSKRPRGRPVDLEPPLPDPTESSVVEDPDASPRRQSSESVTRKLAEARAERELHEAAIADMRRRRMADELVEREAVEAAAFKTSRMMRDQLLGLPARLAPELATVSDAWTVERTLEAALRRILEDVARITGEAIAKDAA